MSYMQEITPTEEQRIHGRFCGCGPCRDQRYDTWAREAAEGTRCVHCLIPVPHHHPGCPSQL